MQITVVEMRSYEWPRPRPIRNGRYTYTTTGLNLVHLHTDAGLTVNETALEPYHVN